MTDDIRPAPGSPVDLLVIGGLTVDVLDGAEVTGGAARYAVEGALSAGLSVGLVTVAGGEAPIRSVLDGMRGRVQLVHQPAQASIRFEHHGAHDRRRLRLVARTDPVTLARLAGIPQARAIVFAPVAGEIGAATMTALAAPLRAAGLQGWLRTTNRDGWVEPTPLSSLDPDLAAALRGLDLLVASERDIGAPDGPSALAALRAWSGPGPELVITAGVHGAWLDSGREPVAHVPAQVVEGRHTIGAGDAFGAVLAARRATGAPLVEAASAAAAATAAYLAGRPPPVGTDGSAPARHHDLGVLEGTAWRAVRFGPGLGETPPGDAEFSLDVAEGRLSGKSGCNRYMGGWTLTDGALGIGPLAGTLMYCTEPLMRLERVYLDAVQGTAGFAVAEDVLTFFDAGGQPLVEFVRAASEGAPEP